MTEAQLCKLFEICATILERPATIIHLPTQQETTPTWTQKSIGFTRSATLVRGSPLETTPVPGGEDNATITDPPTQQKKTLVPGGEDEIKKLKTTLESIRSVLTDAEKRQVKEAVVQLWLDRLRDILYEIDDVLDMWSTAQIKQSDLERPDITFKIKELNEKLGEINRQKDTYQLKTEDFKFKAEGPQREKPTSFSGPSRVFGRDEDTEVILSELSLSSYDIISIVGMGGIGKTTLAQRVYNDAKLKTHFDKRIWVCVSDHELPELQTLLEDIIESISGKKFMLVLDDVWTENSIDLNLLLNSLKSSASGSKILVTTRNVKVAQIIGSTFTWQMGKLSEQESWELFSQMAFFENCAADRENLEDVGREISKKYQGLPLALTFIGSHLRFKTTEREWRNVLNNEIWELEPEPFRRLILSYYDLPSAIKPCFSYLKNLNNLQGSLWI